MSTFDYEAIYTRYCARGHEWVECNCGRYDDYDEEDDNQILTHNYRYVEYSEPECTCYREYSVELDECIYAQCSHCKESAFITHIISGFLDAIESTKDSLDRLKLLGQLLGYVAEHEDFLRQNMRFAMLLYTKCQELEDKSECEPILTQIYATKRAIERC